MKISGLHILLTYRCTYECDHCFVWGSPDQTGIFTLENLEKVFQQGLDCEVTEIFFEGGEAFLFYPLLLKGVQRAHELGFKTGIVSNAYWATQPEDALLWIEPLLQAGLDQLDVSSDQFHGEDWLNPEALNAQRALESLGLSGGLIQVEAPITYRDPEAYTPGDPVIGGDVMYRGRAAEKLAPLVSGMEWTEYKTCPYENLIDPSRLHLDPFGNLHICQGLVIGNLFIEPLREILENYDPPEMPFVQDLIAGGPAEMARRYDLNNKGQYADACHLCYSIRSALREEYPQVLGPAQMYGIYA